MSNPSQGILKLEWRVYVQPTRIQQCQQHLAVARRQAVQKGRILVGQLAPRPMHHLARVVVEFVGVQLAQHGPIVVARQGHVGAEAAVGLAILVTFFRNRGDIAVDDASVMKG